MKRILLIALLALSLVMGLVALSHWQPTPQSSWTGTASRASTPGAYFYYTLKESQGFVLARAPKGPQGQPLGSPRPLLPLGNGFGLAHGDAVVSLQVSPDGNYVAIDGERDHGEQVWIYNSQQASITTQPLNVLGNFLHWFPGGNGHTFLYRPILPLGPEAPMDGGTWNPGLWIVNAATGAHHNLAIGMPSADLIDAAPSPDGSRIVFSISTGLGRGSEMFLMQSDGSELHLISRVSGGGQAVAGLFAWSPDGSQIAYERLSDSSTPFLPAGLWLMDQQGNVQHQLGVADGGHGFSPVWSPDGQKLAFVARTNLQDRLADVNAQALQCAVDTVNIHTGQTVVLASSIQTGMQLNIHPEWTPDSSGVTFTALNAINYITGSTPRYWSAHLPDAQGKVTTTPLSPLLPHIVALS